MEIYEILFGSGEFLFAAVFSILAASLGAAMAVAGGVASGVKAQQAKNRLAQGEARSRDEFTQDYYRDWLNKSDTLSYLRLLGDKMKSQQKNQERANIVHGATPEVGVAQKGKMANAYADAVTKLSSKASDARDAVKRGFQRREDAYDNAWIGVKQQEMKNWSNLAQNGISLATAGFKSIGDLGDTKSASAADVTGGVDDTKAVDNEKAEYDPLTGTYIV